ncbi:nuclear transport factor 2 family protein [Oceanicoccus sagamiensis]|uniref:SnoaL-like domain-containing protein n=1 Tax=Oceanicoccus sagamiensis TaxID=716816 RepID=A0A1X9N442_9GAMM|nr:nuclear transport factor 2 family protein [Oceanicoccus sagamiensis]ARN72938.1 hypothetical protein BST96_01745 [Oceanicoccus sagamiensis]
MSFQDMDQLKAELVKSYNAYAEGIDTKNWALVRSCFAENIMLDYGELSAATGPMDKPRPADDWVAVLQAAINGFDITRHTITNHRITMHRDRVSCRAYLLADHMIFVDPTNPHAGDDDYVTLAGEYINDYQEQDGRWKIVRSQLDVHYTRGNANLFEKAQARAAQ